MPNLPAMRAVEQDRISTTQTTYIPNGTEGKGWARGWLRPLLRILKPSGGRSGVISTDRELHLGPGPQMIVRQHSEKLGGLTGPGIRSAPYLMSQEYIAHQNINRRDAGGISGAAPGMADGMHIPAIYAGNSNNG